MFTQLFIGSLTSGGSPFGGGLKPTKFSPVKQDDHKALIGNSRTLLRSGERAVQEGGGSGSFVGFVIPGR